MHGKILRYAISTGNGVVTNYSKKIFELKKDAWHDNHMLPTAGLYVEFRTRNDGYVIQSARASAWQEFPPGSAIREVDFWKSDTDEELFSMELDARNKITTKIYKETNYYALKSIEPVNTVAECVNLYFKKKYSDINAISGTIKAKDPIFKYAMIKQFLNKALDYLIFNDRKVSLDTFNDLLQDIKKLDYHMDNFQKNVNLNMEHLYEEVFLDWQYNYKGAQKAVGSMREKILQLESKIRGYTSDIKNFRNKMEQKPKERSTFEEKLQRAKELLSNTEEERVQTIEVLKRLTSLTEGFFKSNFKEFEILFKQSYNDMMALTAKTLDGITTQLDDEIWKVAMKSISIKNAFFKHGMNEPFCAMTFMGQYFNKLNVSMISSIQKPTYNYYSKYKKQWGKNFIVFSNNRDLQLQIQLQTMSISKHYSVYTARKEAEYFTLLHKMKFEICYIDVEAETSVKTIVADTRKVKANAAAKVQFIKAPKQDSHTL